MTIQLVSQALVRSHLAMKSTHTDDDALITTFIEKVSGSIESYLNRELENTGTKTEYFSGDGRRRKIFLKRFPIASVTSLHDSLDRSYGSGDLISTDDYAVWDDEGYVELEYPFVRAVRNIKIIYAGGYTAVSGVLPVPDAIKDAALTQISEVFRRRESLTRASENNDFGTVSGLLDVVKLLDGVKEKLDPFRVRTMG